MEQKTDKPWKPTRIEMTASTPLRIRTLAEREWFNGESGEKARGLIYDTGRRVVDDKEAGVRTIVRASRRERMAATPVGERFATMARGVMGDARLSREQERKTKRGESADLPFAQLAYRNGHRRDADESLSAFCRRVIAEIDS